MQVKLNTKPITRSNSGSSQVPRGQEYSSSFAIRGIPPSIHKDDLISALSSLGSLEFFQYSRYLMNVDQSPAGEAYTTFTNLKVTLSVVTTLPLKVGDHYFKLIPAESFLKTVRTRVLIKRLPKYATRP